jgi:metallo-beta-lactamase family protein
MRVTFHGAAGEVTGSMHEVAAAGKRLLLDCGMIQGDRHAETRNVADFPFDIHGLDALVISHAHIDHIGRVPLLVKRGFAGPIYAQAATADLMPIMLLDAASLSEQDAEHANEHRQPGEPEVQPLYTRDDVDAAMRLVKPLPYDTRTTLFPGIDVVFRDAGHILGSSIIELHADDRTLVFSGDLGPKGTPILRDPETVTQANLVLMESTYGDRDHKDRDATVTELGDILEQAWRDQGNVCIRRSRSGAARSCCTGSRCIGTTGTCRAGRSSSTARWRRRCRRCTRGTRSCSTPTRSRCGNSGRIPSICRTCA